MRQGIGGGNTPCGVSPHPHGARLALGLVRQGDGIHYPVGQPLLGDSLPFLLTSVTDKELLRASEAPGASTYMRNALTGHSNAKAGSASSEAVLAGSPPDRGRAWWEPWARIQAGVSGQRESSPARTQGTLRSPKMLGGPRPFDGSERGQERCLSRQVFQLD